MIAGYMTVWLALIIVILLATGWKPYIAPKLGAPAILLLAATIGFAAYAGYWWTPIAGLPSVTIHGAVAVVLVASFLAWAGKNNSGQRGYLLICVLMLAIIWGSISSLYTHDPVLYWLEPGWNSPLLCGLLCCVFTTNIRYQAGALLWTSVIGGVISAWLDNGTYAVTIGSAGWWDSYCLAIATACCGAIMIYLTRQTLAVAGRTWIGMRGGRE
ncbi:MAG: hypothetical protein K0Q63_2785 [Paenibacillus sp.]|jgi:hypothetical protein|nr:hypothetical protein [Paenibacillus sp.]